MYKLDLENGEMNQRSNCQHSLGHRQSKGIPESIYLYFIDYGQTFDCADHTNWKIKDTHRKPVGRSRSNSYNWTWNWDWFKIGKGVMSRLYIVTMFT